MARLCFTNRWGLYLKRRLVWSLTHPKSRSSAGCSLQDKPSTHRSTTRCLTHLVNLLCMSENWKRRGWVQNHFHNLAHTSLIRRRCGRLLLLFKMVSVCCLGRRV